jgi:hypothetical protein
VGGDGEGHYCSGAKIIVGRVNDSCYGRKGMGFSHAGKRAEAFTPCRATEVVGFLLDQSVLYLHLLDIFENKMPISLKYF